jgi:hypothetical protein
MAYLHWNYALVLEIETPCIIAAIGVQAGGGGTRIWEQPFLGQTLSILGAQTMTKLK